MGLIFSIPHYLMVWNNHYDDNKKSDCKDTDLIQKKYKPTQTTEHNLYS